MHKVDKVADSHVILHVGEDAQEYGGAVVQKHLHEIIPCLKAVEQKTLDMVSERHQVVNLLLLGDGLSLPI
jgi:hypothetical protein